MSPSAHQILETGNCAEVPNPYPGPLTKEQLLELVPGVDAMIVGADRIDDEVLAAGDSLRVVCKHGTGVDNIDIAAALARGIAVANVPQANVNAVADIVVGALIALARSLAPADASVRRGEWKRVIGTEVWGKTLGIVGFGAIGQAVARRAAGGFGMKVLAYDPYFNDEAASSIGVEQRSIDELLTESDFVTVHCPLTADTLGLIGTAQLSKMKRSAYLANLARGGVVDETALASALRDRVISGAALDVYEQEPLPRGHAFLELDNVLLLPHIAAYTREAIDLMSTTAARNVVDYLHSGECRNLITRPV